MGEQQATGGKVSDRRKVLSGRSGDLKIMGITPQLVAGLFVAAVLVYVYEQVLGNPASLLVYGIGVLVVGLFYLAGEHSPGHLPIYEHVFRWINHRIRQHTMLNARKGSTKEQPRNDGLLGWIFSQPQIEEMPFVTRQGTERPQDAVQVRRPFKGSPAIERTDGGVVGAIKIRPAAMAVADKGHWEQRVKRLANVIDSSVKGDIQLSSKMRAVDYTNRADTYDAREQQHLTQLAEKHGSIDEAYERARAGDVDEEDISHLVRADLAKERQNVIDMYDVTTLTREYYVIAEVTPRDIVSEPSHRDDSGIDKVPAVGTILKHYREWKLEQEGDYTTVMIDRLEDRLDTLRRDLSTIDGISARTLSSTEYSQVLADHYQAANIYANANFKDLVRLSPTPNSSDGMAMYGVSHDYIEDIDSSYVTGGTTMGESGSENEAVVPDAVGEASALGETETGSAEATGSHERLTAPARSSSQTDDTDESDESSVADSISGYLSEFAERTADANNDPIADVILSEDHLADHYQTIVGPNDIYRGESGWLGIDRAAYSKTISIRGWPAVPKMGILEPILREYEPGVAVNVSTHISPVDQKEVQKDLADEQSTRETSLRGIASSRIPQISQSHEEDVDEIEEMKEANKDSEYDVFRNNTHIELRSDDPEALSRTVEFIEAAMNDEGAMVREETEYHYEGWQSVAPVCQDNLEEPIMMFADGVARQFPWTSRNLHEPNGVEFGINMHTEEPLYLDLWNRDSGFDFGIFTKKGGGKTTTATEILGRLNTVYRDDVMTIIIDPLQEYANLATIHDGERLVVGGDTGINPFHIEETPEEKLATIGKRAPYKHWMEGCMDFIEMYYNDENLPFGEKKGVWRMSIREAAERYGITADPRTHNPEYRAKRQREYFGFTNDIESEEQDERAWYEQDKLDLSVEDHARVAVLMQDLPEDVPSIEVNPRDCPTPMDSIEIIDEMTERPEKWVWSSENTEPSAKKTAEREETAVSIVNNDIQPFLEGGEYEHFTKQTSIDLNDSTFFYVDMQQQEASTSIGLTMQVVYDMFYEMVKTIDIPSVIFMDEFHYMLRDSLAQKSLNQKFRHGRHWDLSLGVATQSFKDFFGEDSDGNTHLTDNAQVLFEGMPTRIYHQEDIEMKWMEPLGLNEDEIKFIRNAEPGNRELGFSTALLYVDDKGTYPMKVKMDFEENPRESVVTEYDPSKHGENMYEYLLKNDAIAEWRFAPDSNLSDAKTLSEEQSGVRSANGTDDISGVEQNTGPDISAIRADPAPTPGGDD